mgnify:CR=1 FL=1
MSQKTNSTNHTQEHANGNKHGTKCSYIMFTTQDITKESQHWDKNQNVSWDELGQL